MDPSVETVSSHTPRRSYSIKYLKSFAKRYQSSPPDVDLREINSELLAGQSPGKGSRGDTALTPGLSGTKPGRRRKARSRKRSQGRESSNSESTTGKTCLTIFKESLPPLKLSDNSLNSPSNEIKSSSSDEFYSPLSDRTSSSTCSKIDLGALFVKGRHRAVPMPAARTLEDIESEMMLSNMSKKTESFLTCEAVEQSMFLADPEYYSSPTAAANKERWQGGGGGTNEDKAASRHLLSVLRKRAPETTSSEDGGSNSEKELLGELISSSHISEEFSNLNGILQRYERIAAADLERGLLSPSKQLQAGEKSSSAFSSSTVDSVRTSVRVANRTASRRTYVQGKPSWGVIQQQQQVNPGWNMLRAGGFMSPPPLAPPPPPPPPNAFVQTRPTVETPLVPQALHALQKLVDHQLHILNSIPGEVTPGMLHERLSRSVLGYPPTGTQLLLATSGYPLVSSRFV